MNAEGADAGIYSDCGTTYLFLEQGSMLNINGKIRLGGIINTDGNMDICTTNQRLKKIEEPQAFNDFAYDSNKEPVAPADFKIVYTGGTLTV